MVNRENLEKGQEFVGDVEHMVQLSKCMTYSIVGNALEK